MAEKKDMRDKKVCTKKKEKLRKRKKKKRKKKYFKIDCLYFLNK